MNTSFRQCFRPVLLAALAVLVIPACGDGGSDSPAPAAAPLDLAVPAISIVTPTTESVIEVNSSPVALTGTASDAVNLTSVSWSNASTLASGTATGTTAWSASIWLNPGPNEITLTATDASGNTAVDTLTVILRAFSLRGWGKNSDGQLGDGTLFNRNRPVTLPYLQGVKQVSAGANHTAALLTDGTLRLWGASDAAQVGSLATGADNPSPVAVLDNDPSFDLKNIVQIAAGDAFTIALDASGVAWMIGGFDFPWDDPTPAVPVFISGYRWSANFFGIANIKQIAAGGNHMLFLLSDGTIRVSGRNDYGQHGFAPDQRDYGNISTVSIGGKRARAVFAGGDSCGAIAEDGTLYLWGRNDSNQLGLVNASPVTTPVLMPGGDTWKSVSFSRTHGLGVNRVGTLYTWGSNAQGQLGIGTTSSQTTPVNTGQTVHSAFAGNEFTVIQRTDGTLAVAGSNSLGQLGSGSSAANALTFSSVSGISGVAQLSVGDSHVVALRGDSPLIGFGLDFDGQLGTDRSTATTLATSPVGVSTGVNAAAGFTQSLVRLADGTAVGFGFNFEGEVGDGTTIARSTAVPVGFPTPLTSINRLHGGFGFSLALLQNGDVWSWGENSSGQLGDGNLGVSNPVPTIISAPPGMTPVSSLAAGNSFVLAVGPGGTLWTWGANFDGQLAFPTSLIESDLPLNVPGVTGVVAVAAGNRHSLALLGDGTVLAWGNNEAGQLGDGTIGVFPNDHRAFPLPVSGLSGVVAIAAGGNTSMALLANGTVRTWGDNEKGQLGVGDRTSRAVPVQVAFLTGVTAISAGGEHGLALLSDGTLRSWGSNEFGQIGDSTTTDALLPTDVIGVQHVVQISAGGLHSLAVLQDGSLRCWGGNIYGNLGDGSKVVHSRPVATVGFPALSGSNDSGAVQIAAGGNFSAAILAMSRVRTWGDNEEGQLGNGTTVDQPKPVVVSPTNVVQVACGREHLLVLSVGGQVNTVGDNSSSQLGRSTTPATEASTFGAVAVSNGIKVATGTYFSMTLTSTGALFHWGENWSGQAGTGAAGSPVAAPTLVPAFPGVGAVPYLVDVACGSDHVLAVDSQGRLWGWGANYDRQVQDTATSTYPTPQNLSLLPVFAGVTFRAVGAGDDHSLAIDMNGNVWTWGRNESGQLGRGSVSPTLAPGIVSFTGATGNLRATAIAGGGQFSVALLSDGSVWTCGFNETGQLGTGDTLDRDEFTQVSGVSGVTSIAAGRQHVLLRK